MAINCENRPASKLKKLVAYLCARDKNCDRKEIAKILGVASDRTIRKYTNGEREINYHQASQLASEFNFCISNLLNDEYLTIKPLPNEAERFKLPEHYAECAYTSGKLAAAYNSVFISLFGEKAFKNFCESEKIDHRYFYNLANPINALWSCKIMQVIAMKNKIPEATYLFKNNSSLRRIFSNNGSKNSDKLDKKLFFTISAGYENNNNYEIVDNCKNKISFALTIKTDQLGKSAELAKHLYFKDIFSAKAAPAVITSLFAGATGTTCTYRSTREADKWLLTMQ